MKRAIIYGRVSTNKQSPESIETQIAECHKWASDNGCTVVDIYDDSGQSGREYNVGNRAGFQQIKHDAKNGRMDYALIYKIDRFARSVRNYYGQEEILERYGVKIIVVGTPLLQQADVITKAVHIAMAEQFSKSLSEDVYVKMRTFARKKAFLGGKPPYGFSVVEKDGAKTLAINELQAAGIRLIYETYLQGHGYANTSKMIAKSGFLNALGEPFTPTHIAKILKSKKYNGWYVFGNREKVDGKDAKTKDRSKVIEVPDAYPKIIDDDTFNAVQARIAQQIPRNKIHTRNYPFTGLITCGICGRAVTGHCTTHNDRNVKQYAYYRCTGHRVNGCKIKPVRADFIEDYIAEKVKRHVFDDTFADNLIAEVEKNLSGDVSSFLRIKSEIVKSLSTVTEQIKAGTRDKYNPNRQIDDATYEELMAELTAEKNALEMRLLHTAQQLNINDKTKEIRAYVEWIRQNLQNADETIKSPLLKALVQSIVLHENKIEVFLHLTAQRNDGTRQNHVSPNLSHGVPRFGIGENAEVHIGVGLSVIGFAKRR